LHVSAVLGIFKQVINTYEEKQKQK
jgi:hypothetical protein